MSETRRIASTSHARRIASRTEPQRWVHPFVWSLLALVIAMGLLAAALSGQFQVRHVTVVGANLPTAQIIQAAGVEGQNIFTVRSDEVIARLQSVHVIAVRRVDVSFPSRVTIYARRRIALAGWRRGNALYLIDPNGRIIKQVATTNLPVITSGVGKQSLSPGVVIAVREAVKLVPRAPNDALAAFDYNGATGLSILGRSGWRAIIGTGTPQAMVTRVAMLVAFLEKPQNKPGQRLKSVDFRFRGAYATYVNI